MLSTAIAVALLATTPVDAPATAAGGVWALAGAHDVAMTIRWLGSATTDATDDGGRFAVVSDLETAVAAVRVDSGLIAWTRRVEPPKSLRGVWVVGDTVVVAGSEAQAFRADVGTRLWSRDLGCASDVAAPCDARVVHADASGVWLAAGGAVQTTLIRLDPVTGAPKWPHPAAVGHARKILTGPGWVAAEEGSSPWAVRFFDISDGHPLGVWTRRIGGLARPVNELVATSASVLAIDTRPGDGMLAHVIVVGTDGQEQTTRRVARAPSVRNQVVWAAASAEALSLFVPDPALGGGQLVVMGLSEPFSASTTTLTSWAEPLVVAGRIVMPPPPGAKGNDGALAPLWSALVPGQPDVAWLRRVDGLGPSVRTFASGDRLIAVDTNSGPDGVALATINAASGNVGGIGTATLAGSGPIDDAAFVGDALVLARGKTLARLVHLPAAEVRARLRRGAAAGGDIAPVLRRLSRFGALADGLADPDVALPADEPSEAPAPVLEPADLAVLRAFAETYPGDVDGTLEGMQDLVDRSEVGSPRRAALLDGIARIMLAEVLATGTLPRKDDARGALVGLARSFEPLASSGRRLPSALWAAIVAKLDEPLVGADILVRTKGTPLFDAAYVESARRSLRAIRTSAGALATTTQRSMLISGLRFFRHLEVVLGEQHDRAQQLMDSAEGSSESARELANLLIAAEGDAARSKSALGPATCALACDAVGRLCGDTDVDACVTRCQKSAVVRLSERARPSSSDDRARWFCR